MTFKETLLKKIKIDQLTAKVLRSIGPTGSGKKTDRSKMRQLLESGPFEFTHQRDLDLYLFESDNENGRILVLDNDLAIYKTDIQDVLLRKSPTIKEMISIRNAIKILSDADVVVSRKAESVKIVHQYCMDSLDLTFQAADIENLAEAGIKALNQEDADALEETLMLFDALLSYHPLPKRMQIPGCRISAWYDRSDENRVWFAPVIIYNRDANELKLIVTPLDSLDKGHLDLIQEVVKGQTAAFKEGPAVMEHLKDAVVKQDSWEIPREPPRVG